MQGIVHQAGLLGMSSALAADVQYRAMLGCVLCCVLCCAVLCAVLCGVLCFVSAETAGLGCGLVLGQEGWLEGELC